MKQMKTICKKISVSILILLMIMTMYLSGSGESLFLKNRDVKAFTGEAKLVMSQALSSNKISEIDRPASEGLWSMTADGHRVFCLNSGKTMCSGDTLKYKTINAATYEKKGIAGQAARIQKICHCVRHTSGHVDMERISKIPFIRQEKMWTGVIRRKMQKSSVK